MTNTKTLKVFYLGLTLIVFIILTISLIINISIPFIGWVFGLSGIGLSIFLFFYIDSTKKINKDTNQIFHILEENRLFKINFIQLSIIYLILVFIYTQFRYSIVKEAYFSDTLPISISVICVYFVLLTIQYHKGLLILLRKDLKSFKKIK
ncbi:hypothetical protein QT06_C0001G0130 [archaeon GW2011_AR15]|nr:hypothetical protein QT06_C0001G0130 [archaeon GW2011_AR15]